MCCCINVYAYYHFHSSIIWSDVFNKLQNNVEWFGGPSTLTSLGLGLTGAASNFTELIGTRYALDRVPMEPPPKESKEGFKMWVGVRFHPVTTSPPHFNVDEYSIVSHPIACQSHRDRQGLSWGEGHPPPPPGEGAGGGEGAQQLAGRQPAVFLCQQRDNLPFPH